MAPMNEWVQCTQSWAHTWVSIMTNHCEFRVIDNEMRHTLVMNKEVHFHGPLAYDHKNCAQNTWHCKHIFVFILKQHASFIFRMPRRCRNVRTNSHNLSAIGSLLHSKKEHERFQGRWSFRWSARVLKVANLCVKVIVSQDFTHWYSPFIITLTHCHSLSSLMLIHCQSLILTLYHH